MQVLEAVSKPGLDGHQPADDAQGDQQHDKISDADLVLAMFDASKDDISIFRDIEKESKNKMLYIANKSDKLSIEQCSLLEGIGCILISAKFNEGVDLLVNKIGERIGDTFTSGSNVLSSSFFSLPSFLFFCLESSGFLSETLSASSRGSCLPNSFSNSSGIVILLSIYLNLDQCNHTLYLCFSF